MSEPRNPDRLFPDDRDATEHDALVARLRASYATIPPGDHAAVERCLHAVRQRARQAPIRGAWHPRWWWGAAAAAVLVLAVMRPWRPDAARHEATSALTKIAVLTPTGSVRELDGRVEFALQLPSDAHRVALVGDFNGWDAKATPMRGRDGARWTVQLPLTPGRHVYAFVVNDGQWIVDAMAPQVPDAEFGPANAVIVDGRQ